MAAEERLPPPGQGDDGDDRAVDDRAVDEDDRDDRAPWLARVFAVLLIGSIVYTGWNAIERWPYTGWRLYSGMRGPTAGSFFASWVDEDGGVHRVDYTEIPDAYSRAPYLLEKFERRTRAEREPVCEALATAYRDQGHEVAAILIHWERYKVGIRDGERTKDRIERELRWSCAEAPGYDAPAELDATPGARA